MIVAKNEFLAYPRQNVPYRNYRYSRYNSRSSAHRALGIEGITIAVSAAPFVLGASSVVAFVFVSTAGRRFFRWMMQRPYNRLQDKPQQINE